MNPHTGGTASSDIDPRVRHDVVRGHPVFVYHDGVNEVRLAAHPGDFVLVPPFVPHREENPDPTEPAVVVIARTTQEAIKVSVPELYPR